MESLMEVMRGVEKNGPTRSNTLLMKEVDKSLDHVKEQLYTTGHLLDFLLAQVIYWARQRNEEDKGERLWFALDVLAAQMLGEKEIIDEKQLDRVWQVLKEEEDKASAACWADYREMTAEELREYRAELKRRAG